MQRRSLTDRILDVLELALRPLTAAEIRRWLPTDVTPEEVASCLVKMGKRGQVTHQQVERRAGTGPRVVKAYSVVKSGQVTKKVA